MRDPVTSSWWREPPAAWAPSLSSWRTLPARGCSASPGLPTGPWLREHGIEPINYAGDVAAAIRAATGQVDAFIDAAGHGNVALALDLGVARDRIDTVVDFAAAAQFGVKTDGSAAAATADTLVELLGLLADGRLELPIGRTFPLDQVREAYRFLDTKHGHGKVVLIP